METEYYVTQPDGGEIAKAIPPLKWDLEDCSIGYYLGIAKVVE